MKIRSLLLPAAAALMFAAAPAMAGDGSTQAAQPATRSIAVLIHVDDHGKVVDINPDIDLQPSLTTLLRQTLDQMISKPAHDAHGNPVASQMVMQLSMTASALADGSYKANFKYIAAKPWPPGRWAWKNIHNGQKPTLVPVDALADRSLENSQKAQAMSERNLQHAQQVMNPPQQPQMPPPSNTSPTH